MRKRLATGLVLLAVLASACGKDDNKDSGTLPSDTTAEKASGPQTLPISVDHKTEPFASSWISFFPSKVSARPGDTLEFTEAFTGAPHGVMAGTLVTELAAAAKKAGPPKDGPPPPELEAIFKKLPQTFVDGEPKPGEDFLVPAGTQPCYTATEDPPLTEACSKEQQKLPGTFTGKERFISSGFMADEDTFKVALADDLTPGTYTFMCVVHQGGMTEEVTVVAKDADVPNADAVKAAGEKELSDLVAKLKPEADKVIAMTNAKEAVAGANPPEGTEIPTEGANVFPKELAIKKGEAVTWTINGFHTIAFNAPEDARPWFLKADDGTVSSNKKTFAPANSPKIPPGPKPAGGDGGGDRKGPPPQVKVDGGKYDGKAFLNSGIPLDESQLVYTLAFTEAGTFTYKCLVHPDMEGTVKVS